MNFKGTKGKWLLNPLRDPTNPEYYCLYVKEGDHKSVQHIGTINSNYNDNPEEMKFNALLISKAPELLSMLISIVNYGGISNMDYIKKLIEESTEL